MITKRQGAKLACIAVITTFILLGIRTASEYHQQMNLLILWAVAIPLTAFTWYLFVRVFDRDGKYKEKMFTKNTNAVILAASLAMACETIYAAF